jgi:transposase
MSIMETMGRTKRPRRSFSKQFKAEVVDLVRQPGNNPASVARDLDLTETAVRARCARPTSTTAAGTG